MSDLKSYLGRHIGRSPSNSDELQRLAKAAWHDRHVLTVPLEEPILPIKNIDRDFCEAIGTVMYGKRGQNERR